MSEPKSLPVGLRLALRGIAYRKVTAAIVLALAIIAATAAVVAPLYARAAQESIARGALTHSDRFARAVHADVSSNGARVALPSSATAEVLQRKLGEPDFGAPVISYLTSGMTDPVAGPQAGGTVEVPLLERVGACAHLTIVEGACANSPKEAVMTTRSAQLLGLKVGDAFDVALTDVQDAQGAQGRPHLTLVGTVAPFSLDDDYWGGRQIFRYYPNQRPHGLSFLPPITDSVLLGDGSAKVLGMQAYSVDVPTHARQIQLDDADGLVSLLTQTSTELSKAGVTVTSQLPALLQDSADRSAVVRVAAPLAAFQLVLLAWVILAHVVSAATQERAPELGLAKLRGLTPARTVGFGLGEVVVLLLVSAPIGTALGWWIVHEVAAHLLEPGISLRVTGWVVVSVVLGVLGGIAAAAVAAHAVARGHVVQLLRRVPGARAGKAAGAVEGAVLALVVAGVVQLVVTSQAGEPGPVASAGPGLIALGGALVAGRILRWLSTRQVARALDRGRPAALVGWAGLARRAGTIRTTGVLAAALCLLLVGVQAWTVAARERAVRAAAETGAAVVLDVKPQSARGLLDAVRSADPGASYAMAVMKLSGDGDTSRALAVDGTRASAVAAFTGTEGRVDDELRPSLVKPLLLKAGVIAAAIGVSQLDSPSPLALSATIDSGGSWRDVPLGNLRPGTHTYSGSLPPSCSTTCRLVALTVSHPATDIVTGHARLAISAISAGPAPGQLTAFDARFAEKKAWRAGVEPASGASVRLTPGSALVAEVATPVGFPARIMHGDAPTPLPAVVGPEADMRDDLLALTGPDGEPMAAQRVATNPVIPVLGRTGVLVDLELLLRGTSAPPPEGMQVWLSRDDPAAERTLRGDLAQAGIQVTHRVTAAQTRAQLDKQGAVLALLLFLACGFIAVLVAIGSLLVAAFVGARQRAMEIAALRGVGMRAGTLRRALLVESIAGLAVALVGAVAAAAVAAWAVLPVLPMADEPSHVVSLQPTPDLVTFGWSVAAVAALLCLLAIAVATRQLRDGTVDRLRDGMR